MSAGAPPSAEVLAAKAAALKKGETREAGAAVDPAVVEAYKKVFADNGGAKDAVCAALGLDATEWVDGMDEKAFLAKFLGA